MKINTNNNEDKRFEMERKEEIYCKNLRKRKLKKWQNLTESIQNLEKRLKKQNLIKAKT